MAAAETVKKPTSGADSTLWINQGEVAKRAGRSRKWVGDVCDPTSKHYIPTFPNPTRLGRTLRFDAAEVTAWLNANRETIDPNRTLEGHQGLGTVCNEALPFLPERIEYDRESCLATFHFPGGATMTRYLYLSESLIRRIEATRSSDDGRVVHIRLIARMWRGRTAPGSFGQTERERFALLNRQPQFDTQEALDEELCRRQSKHGKRGTPSSLLDYSRPLQEVVRLAIAGKGETIKTDVGSLMAEEVGDWMNPETFTSYRYSAISEAVRKQRRREGQPVGSEQDETVANCIRLRELLTTPWHVEALADAGVACRVEGYDVYLSFTDPAEAHIARRDRLASNDGF